MLNRSSLSERNFLWCITLSLNTVIYYQLIWHYVLYSKFLLNSVPNFLLIYVLIRYLHLYSFIILFIYLLKENHNPSLQRHFKCLNTTEINLIFNYAIFEFKFYSFIIAYFSFRTKIIISTRIASGKPFVASLFWAFS